MGIVTTIYSLSIFSSRCSSEPGPAADLHHTQCLPRPAAGVLPKPSGRNYKHNHEQLILTEIIVLHKVLITLTPTGAPSIPASRHNHSGPHSSPPQARLLEPRLPSRLSLPGLLPAGPRPVPWLPKHTAIFLPVSRVCRIPWLPPATSKPATPTTAPRAATPTAAAS